MTTAPEHAAPALWQGGWYRFAHRCDSPNFGPRPALAQVDLIVVHSISLPPGQYGGSQVQQLFANTLDWNAHPYFKSIEGMQVSSHFYIRRNGELWQFVDCDQRAWHAGRSHYRGRDECNDDSIGIELEGLRARPKTRSRCGLRLESVAREPRLAGDLFRGLNPGPHAHG